MSIVSIFESEKKNLDMISLDALAFKDGIIYPLTLSLP